MGEMVCLEQLIQTILTAAVCAIHIGADQTFCASCSRGHGVPVAPLAVGWTCYQQKSFVDN